MDVWNVHLDDTGAHDLIVEREGVFKECVAADSDGAHLADHQVATNTTVYKKRRCGAGADVATSLLAWRPWPHHFAGLWLRRGEGGHAQRLNLQPENFFLTHAA
jgi:hypothetical protein